MPKSAPVAVLAVAVVASLPVLLAGRFGEDGATDLKAVFLAFLAVWLLAGPVLLRLLSPRPVRDGLAAGALVSLLLAGFLVSIGRSEGDPTVWLPVAILGVGLTGLTLALGAASGAIARGGSRGAGALVLLGAALAVGALFLALAPGPMAGLVIAILAGSAGLGLWALTRTRAAGLDPPRRS